MNKAMLEKMLGIEELAVQDVKADFEKRLLNITLDWKTQRADCPNCGGKGTAKEIKREPRKHPVRHLDCFEYKTLLHFDNVEMKCDACGNLFNRRPSFLGDSHYVTLPMLDDWMKKAKGTSIKLVAQWSGESDRTLQEMYFRELGKADETRTIPKVKHLGIDEISQLKGHGQYVLLLYDLDRHEVVEMLPDRRKETLIAYLEEHQDGFLAELEAVCIDMWQHYHDAVKAVFPHVDVVVDRFHVERQLNEALDECRRAKVKKLSDPEKKRLWKKEYRAILLRCLARQMSMPNGEAELDEVLSQDRQLKKLYDLKEQFRDIYAISNYQRASAELDNWLRRARYFGSKFLTDFIETVKRWKTEILGYIKHGITNGVSEGLNCKVKLVKRIGYGYRNFVNFRLRILHTCSETLIS